MQQHGKWLAAGAALLQLALASALAADGGGPPGPAAPAPYTLVQAGRALPVPGRPATGPLTLVIRNDRIERVLPGLVNAPEAGLPAGTPVTVVDLRDRFVLPGLMDAHVHLRQEPSFARRRTERGDRNPPTPAEATVNAVVYARRTLAAGFTTVRDVGSDDQSVFAVRNAINAGRLVGPRILVSGSAIAVTGGHGDGIPWEQTADPAARLADGTCDGADGCREAVRYQYKLGADVIKVTTTGGFGSNTGLEPQLFRDEIEAIVATAHLNGLKVAAHAYSPVAIKDAVRAGVDSIEHGFLLDDEGIRLMKKAGTFLVPTLSASYPPPVFRVPDPESVRLRNEYRAFERAYAAGVRIAFGTDAGTFTHGDNVKEFELMVRYGMPPGEAIRTATVATAELFGIANDAGTLEAGRIADLIAVPGDPLADISALRRIDFVMRAGRIAKREGRMVEDMEYPPAGAAFP
jgi:imidazolonepropionase-like amidohydrolase